VSRLVAARGWLDARQAAVGRYVDQRTRAVRRWTGPQWERWQANPLARTYTPQILLAVLVLWYFATFEQLVWLRQAHFGTFDYDLGMYDQAVWLLSRGRGFMTVRGMQVFGHHANLGYLLFVPAYWLGAGAQFLDVVNTLAVTSCAIPIYLLGRRHLRSDWAGLLLAAAFLFHFIPQWMIQETFHPENVAAPFLLLAFYFASIDRWKPYWWCVALALIWKEDVGLYVLMMGIVIALLFGARRKGAWTFLAGAAWFLFSTRILIPAFSPAGAVFDSLFGPLGSSATDVVRTAVTNPRLVGRTLGEHGAEQGALRMIRPYGYVPLGSPVTMLMGLPQHVINFLSIQSFTWDPQAHYFMLPFVSVTLASVRTVVTRRRAWIGWALIGVMLVGVVSTQDQGVGPWTVNGQAGYWPTESTLRTENISRLMAKVPDGVAVSANSVFVPHLAHRPEIYTFPNPWRSSNFGPGSKPAHRSPERVQWMLIDRAQLTGDDARLFRSILGSGDFTVVEQAEPELYLLRRLHRAR
jgi:uncharacterized membrane protein